LQQQDKEWHQLGIHAPVPSWQRTTELPAELVENYDIETKVQSTLCIIFKLFE
jgi:hypothetical protein